MEANTEFKEISSKLRADINSTKKMLAVFAFLTIFLKFIIGTSIPIEILILLAIWFCLYAFVYFYFLKIPKTSQGLYKFYFSYSIVDFLVLTLIVHYMGGAEWMGIILYVITLVLAGLLLPKKQTMLLSIIAFSYYSSLVIFEYFGFISHKPLFPLEPGLYRSLPFLITQLIIGSAVFYFIADSIGSFSEKLREQRKQLDEEREKVNKAYEMAKEAESVLEIKVKARTKELEELAENREQIIKERTKELQEKVKDLERFQKIAVDRELKMVELKKTLRSAKKRNKDYEN